MNLISFGRFLDSSLTVLCASCKFLASSLQVSRVCVCVCVCVRVRMPSSVFQKLLGRTLEEFCIVSGVGRFERIPKFYIESIPRVIENH